MRFERTDSFKADYQRLSDGDKATLRAAARLFNEACDRFAEDPSTAWPSTLRVKKVRGAPGVWEMTWSFSGPDGRATWEWCTVEDDAEGQTQQHRAVRWRRVGDHSVFRSP